jgi:hypothetical protein
LSKACGNEKTITHSDEIRWVGAMIFVPSRGGLLAPEKGYFSGMTPFPSLIVKMRSTAGRLGCSTAPLGQ